jgi:hypothetical protein
VRESVYFLTGKSMKKLAFIFTIIVVISCRQGDVVEKPDNLLEEDKMVNILYDMSVLQAMRSQSNSTLDSNGIDPKVYIFKKYNVDSTTFVQNHRYYASRLDQYEKIQNKVKEKLEAEKSKEIPAGKKILPAKK